MSRAAASVHRAAQSAAKSLAQSPGNSQAQPLVPSAGCSLARSVVLLLLASLPGCGEPTDEGEDASAVGSPGDAGSASDSGRTNDAPAAAADVPADLAADGEPLSALDGEPGIALQAALAAMQAGLPEQVQQLLGALLEQQPVAPEVQFVAGSAAYELQRFGEAVERLSAAVADDPGRFLPNASALGFAHHKLGQFAEATELFGRIVAVAPDKHKAHYGLALVALSDGRLGDARAALERCLQLQPDYDKARFAEARLLEQEGRDAEALAAVERVVAAWPSHDEALYLMARLLQRAGRGPEADAALARRAHVYALKESLASLRARLGTADDGPGVRLALAEVQLRLDEPLEARRVLSAALLLHPGHAELSAALQRLDAQPGR